MRHFGAVSATLIAGIFLVVPFSSAVETPKEPRDIRKEMRQEHQEHKKEMREERKEHREHMKEMRHEHHEKMKEHRQEMHEQGGAGIGSGK